MTLKDFFLTDAVVRGGSFVHLGHADSPSPETLAYADAVAYVDAANANPNVCAVITKPEHAGRVSKDKGLAVAPDPRRAFYDIHNFMLEQDSHRLGMTFGRGTNVHIHPSAVVSEKTSIGHNVTIGENVVIKDGVAIGNNVVIDAGAVLGAEGLLYYDDEQGRHRRIKHAGGVVIGHDVTILSGAVVAKSVTPSKMTSVGSRSIIGIQANIGHEAFIGENCVISGNCVIARNAKLGDNVWVGASSFLRENITVGAGAKIHVGSVVVDSVKEGQAVSGNFASDHKKRLADFARSKFKEDSAL